MADPPRTLSLVRAERQRADELIRDPGVRSRILDAIRLGTHARPACAAEGIPGGSYDSIVGRGRAESQQWHDGLTPEPTVFGAFVDDLERAIGVSFVCHTKALVDSFGVDTKERGKWMLRRFGPEFAEATKRDDELPNRVSEREIRAMLYAKLQLGGLTSNPAIETAFADLEPDIAKLKAKAKVTVIDTTAREE